MKSKKTNLSINAMNKHPLLTILVSASLCYAGNAAITTSISQAPGPGGGVDFTSSTFISWGYYAGGINQAITNIQSGDTAPTYAVTSGGITTDVAVRNYGWTFSFNDGTSPTTGANLASSGSVNGISASEAFTLTFSNIVSSTEMRRLTLYVGAYSEPAGFDVITERIGATLSGGSSNEFGTDRDFSALSDSSAPGGNNTDSNGIASVLYSVDFMSATETDLVLTFTAITPRSGTSAIGVSGYSLAVVPEPSSALLFGLFVLAASARRRRVA